MGLFAHPFGDNLDVDGNFFLGRTQISVYLSHLRRRGQYQRFCFHGDVERNFKSYCSYTRHPILTNVCTRCVLLATITTIKQQKKQSRFFDKTLHTCDELYIRMGSRIVAYVNTTKVRVLYILVFEPGVPSTAATMYRGYRDTIKRAEHYITSAFDVHVQARRFWIIRDHGLSGVATE